MLCGFHQIVQLLLQGISQNLMVPKFIFWEVLGSIHTDLYLLSPYFHEVSTSFTKVHSLCSYRNTQLTSLLGIWWLIFTINYMDFIFAPNHYDLERFTRLLYFLFLFAYFDYSSLWLDLLATLSFRTLCNINPVVLSVIFFFKLRF